MTENLQRRSLAKHFAAEFKNAAIACERTNAVDDRVELLAQMTYRAWSGGLLRDVLPEFGLAVNRASSLAHGEEYSKAGEALGRKIPPRKILFELQLADAVVKCLKAEGFFAYRDPASIHFDEDGRPYHQSNDEAATCRALAIILERHLAPGDKADADKADKNTDKRKKIPPRDVIDCARQIRAHWDLVEKGKAPRKSKKTLIIEAVGEANWKAMERQLQRYSGILTLSNRPDKTDK
jgi:hypothetical protein